MEILLHFGAHKTATTHLQTVLLGSKPAIEKKGIHYWENQEFRENVMREVVVWHRHLTPVFLLKKLFSPGKYTNRTARSIIRRKIEPLQPRYEKLIISEENLLGPTGVLYQDREIYGSAIERLHHIKGLFQDLECSPCLAIRNPATFLPSIYSEALYLHPFRPFKDIYQGRRPEELSWVPLITAINKVFSTRPLTVWTFEDYQKDNRFVIDWLTNQSTDKTDLLQDKIHRQGFSARAIEIITANPPRGLFYKKQQEAIIQIKTRYPITNDSPKFAPFSPETVTKLTERYQKDLEEIDRISGVKRLKIST
ncbi:MAG: hypothetical protein C0616_14265 [Desulfuromonas sp.]|nr:MAG: hypothetical protein C0616_14265 [Desulfuromonas sp.]